MPKFHLMMIVSTLNESLFQYYPKESNPDLINEMKEVVNRMKTVTHKGLIQTKTKNFYYRGYLEEKYYLKENFSYDEDRPVIFICTDKYYKEKLVDKFYDELFQVLSNQNITASFNLSNELKNNFALIYEKYKDMNCISETSSSESGNLDFGIINDVNNNNESKSLISEPSETSGIYENDDNKRKQRRGRETQRKQEIENIIKWKNLKCFYLVLNIILLVLVGLAFYYFKDEIQFSNN